MGSKITGAFIIALLCTPAMIWAQEWKWLIPVHSRYAVAGPVVAAGGITYMTGTVGDAVSFARGTRIASRHAYIAAVLGDGTIRWSKDLGSIQVTAASSCNNDILLAAAFEGD